VTKESQKFEEEKGKKRRRRERKEKAEEEERKKEKNELLLTWRNNRSRDLECKRTTISRISSLWQ